MRNLLHYNWVNRAGEHSNGDNTYQAGDQCQLKAQTAPNE